MDKRYQIFVSSTFTDLREEREKIFNAIQKLNYIPAGMEFFGAVDEEQLVHIKRIIDNSDYYVLIVGGRYGSMNNNGMSYTEQEYDYAVEKGLKVIALLHNDTDAIPRGKTDKNEKAFEKLNTFREKVQSAGRLVAFWRNSEELLNNFHSSLFQTSNLFPMPGWVRGNTVAASETLKELYELKIENQRLKEQLRDSPYSNSISDLQVEVCSATMPDVFSDKEIECVSIQLASLNNFSISPQYLHSEREGYNANDIIEFWRKAIPWFRKILSTCRIDIRVTNTNSIMGKNLIGENELYLEDGTLITDFKPHQYDKLDDPPSRPDTNRYSHHSQQEGVSPNLNPKQSTLYTHCRHFIPTQNMIAILKRRITGENILPPIEKEFKIHFRIQELKLSSNEVFEIIDRLEKGKKLNDIGVYDFVHSLLLSKDNEESSSQAES